MPTYKYEIEALTPLHIGSGHKIYPLEYVINEEALIRVNMEKLFTDPDFDREAFIKKSRIGDFYIGAFSKELAIRYPQYSISISRNTAQSLMANIGTTNALILDFNKEAMSFFIPGSSIKGAMRTAVLYRVLENSAKKTTYEKGLKTSLHNKKNRVRGGKIKKEQFSLPSEESILGRPNNSIMRSLQVSDSSFIPQNEINVCLSRVMSCKEKGYQWKQLGRSGANTSEPGKATPIYFEALKAGSKTTGSLKIDDFILKSETASALGIRDVIPIEQIIKTCNLFAQKHLEREEIFFQTVGLKDLQTQIKKIKTMKLDQNEFLLRVGWGSGYESKALGNLLDDELFRKIKKEWRMGREGMLFPKTRKIVFEDDSTMTETGWIKMRLKD
ncbi:MAG: type III-A CRISPR-associated RAMP protein Csm5 [Desulfobacteraceae bacterium]|jgi:CRISPR-associated protein Csm5